MSNLPHALASNGRTILKFGTTPGHRLSREFETSSQHGLSPLSNHRGSDYQIQSCFHILGVSLRLMLDCPPISRFGLPSWLGLVLIAVLIYTCFFVPSKYKE